jgi:hypothetical protein
MIDDLATLGKDIVARVSAADRSLEAAHRYSEQAGTARQKANNLLLSAGKMLLDARSRVLDFTAFLAEHCAGLGRSRAYELISIAEGKSTPEATRAKTNERKRRHRAARAARPFHPERNGREANTTADASAAQPAASVAKDLAELKYAFNLRFPRLDEAAQAAFVEHVMAVAADLTTKRAA